MKFIIGKKLDMTQVWQGDKVVAVTRVQAGPCIVAQVKTNEKDGYSAAQVGYGERKEKNIAKPQQGHMKGLGNFRYLREFRIAPNTPIRQLADAKERQGGVDLKRGDVIDVNTFEVGDKIQVTSFSKGKGFQGVVKRHGFHGQDKTHGTKDQLRMPGSIGATGPAHVFKGQKMPGRMGGDRVTVKGLEVVKIDKENDVLLVKGAVPGARNGLVLIQGEGELRITQMATDDKQIAANHKSIKKDKEKKSEDNKDVKAEKKDVGEEDIEKVVVEAKEKVEDKKKDEDKK